MKLGDKSYLNVIFASLGFIFLRSGYGKVTGGKFVETLPQTLEKFASLNPYPFYKQFLQSTAIPNAEAFGMLTMWGEVLTGMALLGVSLYCLFTNSMSKALNLVMMLGFLGAMFLSVTFYLAAGWSSPSTESLNLLMFVAEAAGFLYSLNKFASQK